MTDAERIAVYLREDIHTVWRALREPHKSDHGAIKQFAAMLSDVRREEKDAATDRCLDILVRVGITAMEAGHTMAGKYIAAASTKIRGSL